MPDIKQTIRARRTIHDFLPDSAPPEEIVLSAIEHAIWAPNHHLSQPWRFYMIGPGTAERICELNASRVREAVNERAADIKLQRWRAVPGWLLLTCVRHADARRAEEDYAACCCAAQNLMLCLWEEGIGMKWTTGDVTRDPEFFEILGIDPQIERVVGLFWYGRAADVPGAARIDTADLVKRLP